MFLRILLDPCIDQRLVGVRITRCTEDVDRDHIPAAASGENAETQRTKHQRGNDGDDHLFQVSFHAHITPFKIFQPCPARSARHKRCRSEVLSAPFRQGRVFAYTVCEKRVPFFQKIYPSAKNPTLLCEPPKRNDLLFVGAISDVSHHRQKKNIRFQAHERIKPHMPKPGCTLLLSPSD